MATLAQPRTDAPDKSTSTPPIPRPDGGDWRRGPVAHEALDRYLEENPDERPVHTHALDVSEAEIYAENRWEPIFAQMRAAGPVHHVPESPSGPYWSVVTHEAIQHVESLPDIYSSSWEQGGITILDREDDLPPEERMELPMFIAMDRPKHTGQRRTVAPAFKPAEMKRMDEEIRRRTGQCLDQLARGRGVRLGRPRLDRADDGNAGDPVRLPVGGPAAADPLVRLVGRYRDQPAARARPDPPPDALRDGGLFPAALGAARQGGAGAGPDEHDDPFAGDEPAEPRGIHGQPRPADRRRQRHHAQHDERRDPFARPLPRPAQAVRDRARRDPERGAGIHPVPDAAEAHAPHRDAGSRPVRQPG